MTLNNNKLQKRSDEEVFAFLETFFTFLGNAQEVIDFLEKTCTEDGKNKFDRYAVRKKTKNEH